MVRPNPRTMALMTTYCSETSEKTRDHSKINGEDVSLHISWSFDWRAFCLLKLSWTLAGSGLMLSNNACIAGRDTSAQLTPALWLPAASFCRRGVDTWVERWWAVLSREAVCTDVLCKEGKSWWFFKQAPRSPFHGLRCDAFRARAKWTLCSSCYIEIIPDWKLNWSSAWYIFRNSYQISLLFVCRVLLSPAAFLLSGLA